MSDGNFNRALLPKGELSAGIREGKAQMRTKAQRAFAKTLTQFLPEMNAERMAEMESFFMQELRSK